MIEQTKKVLNAIFKDLERRYISTSKLQSDGRLELDKLCLQVLNPQNDEEFFVIDDNSSVIIVRNPLDIHKNKIIATAKYENAKNRLRLSQIASRKLLTCKIGIKVFSYNGALALEIEPFIDAKKEILTSGISSIDELAPYILRSSRSVLHIDVFDRYQKINHSGTKFRILGEYWITKWHQNITDIEFKYIKCDGSICKNCYDELNNLTKTIVWYPIIAYEQNHYPRPGLISFHSSTRNTSTTPIHIDLKVDCKEWAKKCGMVEQYFKRGIIDYTGDKLYKIETTDVGDVVIEQVTTVTLISMEENGLMRLALKELMDTVTNYKP